MQTSGRVADALAGAGSTRDPLTLTRLRETKDHWREWMANEGLSMAVPPCGDEATSQIAGRKRSRGASEAWDVVTMRSTAVVTFALLWALAMDAESGEVAGASAAAYLGGLLANAATRACIVPAHSDVLQHIVAMTAATSPPPGSDARWAPLALGDVLHSAPAAAQADGGNEVAACDSATSLIAAPPAKRARHEEPCLAPAPSASACEVAASSSADAGTHPLIGVSETASSHPELLRGLAAAGFRSTLLLPLEAYDVLVGDIAVILLDGAAAEDVNIARLRAVPHLLTSGRARRIILVCTSGQAEASAGQRAGRTPAGAAASPAIAAAVHISAVMPPGSVCHVAVRCFDRRAGRQLGRLLHAVRGCGAPPVADARGVAVLDAGLATAACLIARSVEDLHELAAVELLRSGGGCLATLARALGEPLMRQVLASGIAIGTGSSTDEATHRVHRLAARWGCE